MEDIDPATPTGNGPRREPPVPGAPRRGAPRSRTTSLAALLGSLAAIAGCGSKPPPPPAESAPEPKLMFVEEEAPFIVDWDAEQVNRLSSAVRGGNIGALVVAKRRGVVRLLPDCWVSGVYVPSGIGMYRGMLQVRRGDSLDRKEGVRPEALQQVATSENVPGDALLDYRFVVVGRHDVSASRKSARYFDLSERAPGACRGATHFIRAALTGAFERAMPPGPPQAGKPGQDKLLSHGGDFTACLTAGTAASAACTAFLKIELAPIEAARVELRMLSFKLGGMSVPSVQFLFRGKGDYRAGTTPFTAASATTDWALPAAEITEESPLIVEVSQPSDRGPQVIASGEITPADLRKAVFEIELRSPGNGARVGAVQLSASEPAKK